MILAQMTHAAVVDQLAGGHNGVEFGSFEPVPGRFPVKAFQGKKMHLVTIPGQHGDLVLNNAGQGIPVVDLVKIGQDGDFHFFHFVL